MSPLVVVTLSAPLDTLYRLLSSRTMLLQRVVSRLLPSNSSPAQPQSPPGASPLSRNWSNDTVSPWPSACGPNANSPKSGDAIGFSTGAGNAVQVTPSNEYSPV